MEVLANPWPWYVSGPLIALVMYLLLWAGGNFGVSSTLRSICSISGAGRSCQFFDFDWKSQTWNLVFVLGAVVGGFIAAHFLSNTKPILINPDTINDLADLGIEFNGEMAPTSIFGLEALKSLKGAMILIIGGFMVGFGTRWAGGCTSGHAISGLSNLQLPSLIAVVGFFIGGLIMTFLLFPLIF